MMQGILKLFVILSVCMFSASTSVAAADLTSTVCKTAPTSSVCQAKPGNKDPIVGIINTAATIIASVTGIAAVFMVILGGFGYVTSGGNPEATKKARQRIIYGLIGAVVVALSWTLIRFITDNFIK